MSEALKILFVIRALATEGLPALNAIAAEIAKWGGAEKIPVDAWEAMFAKYVGIDYWSVVDKPTSDSKYPVG